MFKTGNQLRLICLLVFLLFSPTLFAELSLIDDQDAYNYWNCLSGIGIKDIFMPGSEGAAYYRPFITVSYLWDKYVWLLDTRLMHLDNIFFHMANSLLVYWLTWLLLPMENRQNSLVPLSAALLFGLHPITVESVAWISGRTDVMAGTFLLLGAIFFLKFKFGRRRCHLALSFFFLFIGLLFKEVVLGFFIAVYFLLRAREDRDDQNRSLLGFSSELSRDMIAFLCFSSAAILLLMFTFEVWPVFLLGIVYYLCPDFQMFGQRRASDWLFGYLRQIMVSLLGIGTAIGLFFAIRKIAYESDINKIPQTLNLIFQDIPHTFRTYFGACGFYVKKFFLPLPLNVAIREVDPLYQFAGVLVFFFCLYLIRRRTVLAALFLTGVLMFVPALPLSMGTVAWTAYAERYIYISTAIWSVVVVLWVSNWSLLRHRNPWLITSTCVLLLGIGAVSFDRCLTWQTNRALFHDTVQKEPHFKLMRNVYMISLILDGEYDAARVQYQKGSSIPSISYEDYLDLNMAAILVAEGKHAEALDLYELIVEKSHGKSENAFVQMIRLLRSLIGEPDYSSPDIYARIIKYNEGLYALSSEPYLLYQTGKDAISAGEKALARQYFSKALEHLPADSQYRGFAERLLAELQPVSSEKLLPGAVEVLVPEG